MKMKPSHVLFIAAALISTVPAAFGADLSAADVQALVRKTANAMLLLPSITDKNTIVRKERELEKLKQELDAPRAEGQCDRDWIEQLSRLAGHGLEIDKEAGDGLLGRFGKSVLNRLGEEHDAETKHLNQLGSDLSNARKYLLPIMELNLAVLYAHRSITSNSPDFKTCRTGISFSECRA